jgi:hypothetical protein
LLQQATQVLQQGIDLLTSTFPDRCAAVCGWSRAHGVRALVGDCGLLMLRRD